jgi:SNF2 family DNA or RNA helicase
VGINLQEFDRIIFSSPWWTKALMDQAIGRAVRIGQQKQVVVYNILLKEEDTLNIDKLMNAKAEIKGELNRKILSYADNNLSL